MNCPYFENLQYGNKRVPSVTSITMQLACCTGALGILGALLSGVTIVDTVHELDHTLKVGDAF